MIEIYATEIVAAGYIDSTVIASVPNYGMCASLLSQTCQRANKATLNIIDGNCDFASMRNIVLDCRGRIEWIRVVVMDRKRGKNILHKLLLPYARR